MGATETRLHEPLEAVKRDGRIADPSHEEIIRDAVALHFIRSIPTAALHQATWRERREAARQKWRDNPQMLEWIHVNSFGWWADDPARPGLALDEFYRPVEELIASDAVLRVSLEDRFQRARVGFQSFDLKILAAPDREFLIGDVPVLAMREGHGGLGIFDGVGLANADEIALPLTPHHVVVLGQGGKSREATADEVARYNTLAVRLAYRHVYMRPSGELAPLARSLLSVEPAWPTTCARREAAIITTSS
ncbi:MAG: DUF4238 domain-containing protein [Streptosporangiaceae bacterium]